MAAAAFRIPVWARPERPPTVFLPRRDNVDIAFVGGGILGLSTALHAARAGKTVQVLEAGAIGEGGSGLNGGQVIPGLKDDAAALIARFGKARGKHLADFADGMAERVFELIAAEKMQVPNLRTGWISAAHTEAAVVRSAKRVEDARARGEDVVLLDARAIATLTGAQGYLGGWLDKRGGVIDPLSFTLELARVATEAGAAVAEHSRVTRLLREDGRWSVELADGGQVSATSVVVATNAYSDDLVPRLRQTIVPLHSFQIATVPLANDVAAAILPQGQAVSDSRRIVVYYRKSPDGRFVMGGHGRMSEPTSPDDWKHLVHAMGRLYPQLADVAIERRWFGRVAMTPDHLPHVHEPEKGLVAVVGCQGRGIGLMTALGRSLARYLETGDPDTVPFPITPIRPIPLHSLRRIGVTAAITWYRLRDATEQ